MTVVSARYGYKDDKVKALEESLRKCDFEHNVIWLREQSDPELDPILARWQDYARVLGGLPANEPCIVCDSRDVIFQNEPSWDWSGLQFHLEKSTKIIGYNLLNYNWIMGIFGYRCAYSLRFNPIVCAGVISGFPMLLRKLALRVARYVNTGMFQNRTIQNRTKEMGKYWAPNAHDQGIVNYLAYSEFRDCAAFFTNELGPVCHCEGLGPGELVRHQGVYRRPDGHTPTVVHQYDRIKAS